MYPRTKTKIVPDEGLAIYALIFESERIKQTHGLIYRKRGVLEATLIDVVSEKGTKNSIIKQLSFNYGHDTIRAVNDFFRLVYNTQTAQGWQLMQELQKLRDGRAGLQYVKDSDNSNTVIFAQEYRLQIENILYDPN